MREVVDQVGELADQDEVSLLELVQICGTESFVPVLVVLALLVVSPLSGIPLFPSFAGAIIAFVSLQMLLQQDHLWLSGFVGRRTFSGHHLKSAMGPMRQVADFFDRHTRADRLRQLVSGRGRLVPQTLCVVAGVLMPLLEIVPFSSSVLGAAVLCLALSLLTRDGLLTVLGVAILSLVILLPSFVLGAAAHGVAP